jgi:Xaa-Pro aminopeptidase
LDNSKISARQLQIWNYVKIAQKKAFEAVSVGTLTRSIDAAARLYLDSVGYASYFTHRLGHGGVAWLQSYLTRGTKVCIGIGLEVHEEPYLRGGSDTVIQSGHTFSNEPGIYVEGEVWHSAQTV